MNLKIVNNFGEKITVQVRDLSVNGIMIDGLLSSDVVNGKTAFDSIMIFRNSLDEAGIDVIENVEFSFHIFKSKGWETILDSEPVTLSRKAR